MTLISGTHPEPRMIAWERSLGGFRRIRLAYPALALMLGLALGCRKQEAARETAAVPAPAAQLPAGMPREILGRWKVITYGVLYEPVGMISEEADQYLDKIAVIEPGRAVMKDHHGDELACSFSHVKVTVRDTVEYFENPTYGESPGNPDFDSFIKRINSKTIRVFEPQPDCGVTPFIEFFMPDSQTMVVRWNGIHFFMVPEGADNKAKEVIRNALDSVK